MLEIYPEVDGIVACNDIVAISAYKVLHQKGIQVPKQIQLIGYDNIRLAELVTPELTTVAQPIERIGVKAVELLLQKEEKEKEYIYMHGTPEDRFFPHRLRAGDVYSVRGSQSGELQGRPCH